MELFVRAWPILLTCLCSQVIGSPLNSKTAYASPTLDPYDDPFYRQPSNLGSYKAGDVIDSRRVVTSIFGPLTTAYQIKYRTTDNQMNKAWLFGTKSKNTPFAALEGPIVVPWALARGYYVVQPDAYGPNSTLLVGRMEGQAVLDAIRATINFKHLDKPKSKAVLYGYSGGAHSTIWAAELNQEYAPDVNIIAASSGGTPVDLQSAFNILNGSPEAVLVGGAILGLAQGYPALEDNLFNSEYGLNKAGKAMATTMRAHNYCLYGEESKWNGTNFNKYFKKPIVQNPVLKDVMERESLLTNVSCLPVPVPKFPRFQYHGQKDVTVPYAPAVTYVEQQCAHGAKIFFQTYPGENHADAAFSGILPALNFIGQAFDGILPPYKCGTNTFTF